MCLHMIKLMELLWSESCTKTNKLLHKHLTVLTSITCVIKSTSFPTMQNQALCISPLSTVTCVSELFQKQA